MPKMKDTGILNSTLGSEIKNDRAKVPEITTGGFVPIVTYDTFETRILSKKIEVSRESLGDDTGQFDIELDFINSASIKKSKSFLNVAHKKNAYDFSDPKISPSATARLCKNSFQRISVTCTQHDPYAETIRLYYRTVDTPKAGNTNNFYKFHTSIKLKPSESYSGVFNIDTLGKNLILRFVSVSMLGQPGAFIDVVVRQLEKNELIKNAIGPKESLPLGFLKGSLISDSQGSGVRIRWINGSHQSAGSIYLLRKKCRRSELGPPHIVSQASILMDNTANNSETFDTDVEPGFFYEYILYGNNGSISGTDLRTLINYQEFPTWMNVKVNYVKGEEGSYKTKRNTISSFDLIATVQQAQTQLLLEFLNDVGLSSAYADDLTDIKEKLHLFSVFKVYRKDFSSGRVKDLGFHRPGNFKDTITNNSNMSVQAAYIFELFVGNPPDIIASLKAGSELDLPPELQVTDKDLEKELQKDNPNYTSREAFTSSTVTNNRNRGLNLLKTGFVYSYLVRSSQKKTSAEIIKLKARRISTGVNIVSWSVAGFKKSIDHFIIYSTINGKKSIAGVCHHVPTKGSTYKFYDLRLKGAIGTVYYQVCPVSLSFRLVKSNNETNLIQMV